MNINDLTEDQKDKINSALNGCSSFSWTTVSHILEVEDAEDHFDCEADVMDACDLEYCEICGCLFSRNDGWGENSDDLVVCPKCGEEEED